MKNLCLALMLVQIAWAAPPPPLDENLWLKTESRWTRTDYYGLDRNHNGVIDADEWERVVTQGSAIQPWNQPRALRDGETHRWELEWDETYESKDSKEH